MIPNNLKGSRCYCAALSLPVMGKEEMRRVPKLPGSLAEELAALPRVPVDGHEMYLAGAGEVDQACDNLLPEVSHDTQLANCASDESEGCGEALPVDEADAGGDQADAVQPVDRCVLCGDPVEDGSSIHIECIPF